MRLPTLQFGLLGAGAIAQTYSAVLLRSDRCQLAAVADPRFRAAEAIAELHHCRNYASAADLLREARVDAVIVATPPATHVGLCLQALQSGRHVLCEKPLAIESLSARRILEAARARDLTCAMASKFRYVRDVVQAKAIAASGILGELVLLENAFSAHVDMQHRWNSDPTISGGGVLIDNGTHSVDLLRFFLGPLAEVQATEGKRVQGLQVEETVHLFLRSCEGVMASVDLSWSIQREQAHYLSIYGSAGTALIGWKESKYRRHGDAEWTVFGGGYHKEQAFHDLVHNFADAVQGREPLIIHPEDALASVDVIEVAYQALHENTWKPIGSPQSNERSACA